MTNTQNKRKKPQEKKHRIPLLQRGWMIALMAIVVIAVITIIIVLITKPKNTADNTTTAEEVTVDNRPRVEIESKDPDQPPEKTIQYEGEDPNELGELTGSVTYKNVEDGTLSIAAIIDQYLPAGGTCTLELTPRTTGGKAYSAQQPAVADATTSLCETFEVPLNSLSPDYYYINITISGDNKTGLISDEVQL